MCFIEPMSTQYLCALNLQCVSCSVCRHSTVVLKKSCVSQSPCRHSTVVSKHSVCFMQFMSTWYRCVLNKSSVSCSVCQHDSTMLWKNQCQHEFMSTQCSFLMHKTTEDTRRQSVFIYRSICVLIVTCGMLIIIMTKVSLMQYETIMQRMLSVIEFTKMC